MEMAHSTLVPDRELVHPKSCFVTRVAGELGYRLRPGEQTGLRNDIIAFPIHY